MKPKKPIGGTYEQWIDYYNATAPGDTWAVDPGEGLIYDPDHGIIAYNVDLKYAAVVIGRAAGDGVWIEGMMTSLCKHLGLKKGILLTYRDPRAFIRKFGMKVHAVFLEKEVE